MNIVTPEQQIREALEAVVGGHTSGAIARASARTALAALARLVANHTERETWFEHATASWKAEEEDWIAERARLVAERDERERELQEARAALHEIRNAASAGGPGEMPARWFAERAREALGGGS